MPYFDWNSEKNEYLKEERGVGFEDVIVVIEGGGLLDVLEHPNTKKYPDQKILVVLIENYACLVPFVENDEKLFLKTIIPSRKATKKYVITKQN